MLIVRDVGGVPMQYLGHIRLPCLGQLIFGDSVACQPEKPLDLSPLSRLCGYCVAPADYKNLRVIAWQAASP